VGTLVPPVSARRARTQGHTDRQGCHAKLHGRETDVLARQPLLRQATARTRPARRGCRGRGLGRSRARSCAGAGRDH
jgi:hypothetical protein